MFSSAFRNQCFKLWNDLEISQTRDINDCYPLIHYFDLDTILCNSIECLVVQCKNILLDPDNRLDTFVTLSAAHLETEGRSCGLNSSIIIWRLGTFTWLYDFLVSTAVLTNGLGNSPSNMTQLGRCIYKFDHYLEMMLLRGENDCTSNHRVLFVHDLCPNVVVDYGTIRSMSNNETVSDLLQFFNEHGISKTAIVIFPLFPKPHEIIHAIEAKQYGNSLWKAQWILQYWNG